jgi:uncharacterized protein YdhG (YjbR/CyaY superfamily)
MKAATSTPETIDAYIAAFQAPVQKRLQQVRRAVVAVAPKAQPKISYRMPAFSLNGNRIYFAAFKKHIGLYPGPEAILEFQDALAGFPTSKGAIQFPFDAPLPLPLIKEIVRFRLSRLKGSDPGV